MGWESQVGVLEGMDRDGDGDGRDLLMSIPTLSFTPYISFEILGVIAVCWVSSL